MRGKEGRETSWMNGESERQRDLVDEREKKRKKCRYVNNFPLSNNTDCYIFSGCCQSATERSMDLYRLVGLHFLVGNFI